MSSHPRAAPVAEHKASGSADAASVAERPGGATQGIRRAALVAGASLMAMAGLAGFANLVVVQGLVTPGNAAKTAQDITASEGMFRLAVVALYLVVVLDVVVAWALMRIFSPVNQEISRLSAWFRLAYAAVFLVAVSQLAGIPQLLNPPEHATAFSVEQLQALALQHVDTFNDIWYAGLVLFGVHLALVGYLAYRSTFVPRVIAVLLVVAGAGYVFDSVARVLSEGSPLAVSTVTFLGEFLLGLWLLARGRRIPAAGARSRPLPEPQPVAL
jgi:hypothetical protein